MRRRPIRLARPPTAKSKTTASRSSLPASGTADSAKTKKIASGTNGGPALANGDMFGSAVAAIGDLDGDGVGDLAVGAPSRFGEPSPGRVHVLFMNANGTVKAQPADRQRHRRRARRSRNGDYFGHSVASLGDLDGDGVTDLAVGASKDDTGGYIDGAVYVLFMNANGTVKSSQKIASGIGGGPTLASGDRFGSCASRRSATWTATA